MTRALSAIVGIMTFIDVGIATAAERVTLDNFKRAETHYYMKERAEVGCFGKICHERTPKPVEDQSVIRLNRDTLYSFGVFDLTSPVAITMPDAGNRFQSLVVINEDHYIKLVSYEPGTYTLSRDSVGSRYAFVAIRTFMDPNNPADVASAHTLQDEIKSAQTDQGRLELPDWDQTERRKLHDALLGLGPFLPDSRREFGDVNEVDPVRHLVATSGGWGGNREQDALYVSVNPKANDGATPHTLTVKDVPVDGFWSITVYNDKGFYEKPENAISINNVTAKKNPDGSVTVNFGGNPSKPNYLRIMPGWNYTVRLYRPRSELLEGKWIFPSATPSD